MAVDYFMKIDNVDGESKDKKYVNWIELESWSWGASQAGTQAFGGGGGSGKVSMQDFHFTKKIDKSTFALLEHCATGKHFNSCKMIARKAGGTQQDYMVVEMKQVLVGSYNTGGQGAAGGGDLPMEQVSMNFAEIEITYSIQDDKGIATRAGSFKYNQKENTGTRG